MPNISPRIPVIHSLGLRPLPASRIEAAVLELAEALRRELKPGSAIEQSAIEEYIEIECQRRRLRLIRDQIERSTTLGQIWRLLSNALMQAKTCEGLDTAHVDQEAQEIVQRWSDGDPEAHQTLSSYGIDVDEAIAKGVQATLPQLAAFNRECEHLGKRARLLLDDIERTQLFRAKRKLTEIDDAEIIM